MARIVYKYISTDHSIYVKRIEVDKQYHKINGEFYVGKANELLYKVQMPNVWKKEYGLNNQIKLLGTWQLDVNNVLTFYIKKQELWQSSQKIFFKTSIIENKANALVLSANFSDNDEPKFGIITLRGKWVLDNKNRLNFLLSHNPKTDRLRFRGQWSIDCNNILTYILDDKQALQWQGFWSIGKLKRLVYKIKGSSDSLLEFKVSIESNSLRANDDFIKFRIGVSTDGSDSFSLFGVWKLYRHGVLEFALKNTNNKSSLKFNVKKIMACGSEVVFTTALLDKPWFKLSFNKKFIDKNKQFKLSFKQLVKSWQVEAKYEFLF